MDYQMDPHLTEFNRIVAFDQQKGHWEDEKWHIDPSQPPTEFILSLRKKKEWMHRLNAFGFPSHPTPLVIDQLLELFTKLNRYNFSDPILIKLFDYLCQHSDQLSTCVFIKRFSSPETIQKPYYNLLRQKLSEKEIPLGNYFTTPVFIVFMLGNMVGYSFSGTELEEFDTPSVKTVFKNRVKNEE